MKRKIFIVLIFLISLVFSPSLSKACESGGHYLSVLNKYSCCQQMEESTPVVGALTGQLERTDCSSRPTKQCTHNCHCRLTIVVPVYLAAKPFRHAPMRYLNIEWLEWAALHLPSGAQFIWRPPKIG